MYASEHVCWHILYREIRTASLTHPNYLARVRLFANINLMCRDSTQCNWNIAYVFQHRLTPELTDIINQFVRPQVNAEVIAQTLRC